MTNEIPADILAAAGELVNSTIRHYENNGFANVSRDAVAKAILDERQKAETLADEMYLTGVTNAEVWARKWGHHDFADRLVREVNERAKASGLPPMRASA